MFKRISIVAVFIAATFLLRAEEGMWTYFNLPLNDLKSNYNFSPTQEWLDHVRLSSVRFMDGGSGSFVSPDGLVMTNHHVGVGQIAKLSTAERDLVAEGFYAQEYKQELKCADLEVNILVKMQNITDQIKGAVTSGMSAKEALDAKQHKIDQIEKEETTKSGLRSDVVSFYTGGEYWLYQYKKYTDVRLVFAPERQAAYFGGDNDNFTYPRWNFDVTFFRVYDNGKPLKSKDFFKWSEGGAKENDLVFMSGNPGGTSRLKTLSQIKFARDYSLPIRIEFIQTTLDALRNYARTSEEAARRALIYQFGYENSKKAISGQYNGLKNPETMEIKAKQEADFIGQIKQSKELSDKYLKYFDQVDQLLKEYEKNYYKRSYRSISSKIFGFALGIVRYTTESQKPDMDRLPGYNDAALHSMKFRLTSPAPVYKDVDKALTWAGIKLGIGKLSVADEFWRQVFEGSDPREFMNSFIDNSQLDNAEFRTKLIEGGMKALENCKDPAIKLALKLDKYMRTDDKNYRDNFESKLAEAQEKIAEARFLIYGNSKYPDANFTLRLTYGQMKGYEMNGTKAPAFTTLYGMWDRSISFGETGDYALPKRFWDKYTTLNLRTPMNFVSTCDIIGGNSGSPTINKDAEIVGIVFDGNIESLVGDYVYDITSNRALSVHSDFIIYALRNLYDAGKLADELQGK